MRDDPLVLGVKPAGKWQDAMRRHGMTLEELEELSSGDALIPHLGVFRGTHEIVEKPQIINTDPLVPTGAIIEFPAIRNQLTKMALVTTSDDESSPFWFRHFNVPLPNREGRSTKAWFRGHHLGEEMTFATIVKKAGGLKAVREKHLVTQWQIRRAVEPQSKGEDGPLLTDSCVNFFFVLAPQTDKGVAIVSVYRSASGRDWNVWAYSLSHDHWWRSRSFLFLRTKEFA